MREPLQRTLVVALLLFAATVTVSAQYVVSTPIDFNNNQNGVMFDVDATTDLRITGIDVIAANSFTSTWEVWRVTNGGSYVGLENDPSAWTLVGSRSFTTTGTSALQPLGIALDIEVAGSSGALGLYVTSDAGLIRYTSGTNSGGLRGQGQHLQIFEGVGKDYPFGATFGSSIPGSASRMFNGQIHYELGSAGEAKTLATPPWSVGGNGITFDIDAQENVTIENFSVDLAVGTYDLEVWTTVAGGSSNSVLSNPSAWVLAGRVNNYIAPISGVQNVGFDLDVPIAAGETRGFYVTRAVANLANFRLNTATVSAVGDTVAVDEAIEVKAGNARNYFLGTTGVPAGFVGDVHYRTNLPADSTSTSISTLTTPDGPNLGEGLYFDLAAVADFVQIDDLDAIMLAGIHTVELWTVNDRTTHIGKETNQALWTMQGTATVNVGVSNTMTDLFSDLRIVLEPGQAQGCYLVTNPPTAGFSYSGIHPAGVAYASNSEVEVRGGSRSGVPWAILIANRGPDIRVQARYNLNTTEAIAENFSGGAGILAPNGWLSHVGEMGDPTVDGWNFSNPQPINPAAMPPIDADFAVVDSDLAGFGVPIDASLYSPCFDATQGKIALSFDHFHRDLGSSIMVDVWDGSVWNSVLNTTAGTDNPERAFYDITAAAGNSVRSRVRFRYVANYDWHWAIDNVRINSVGTGQEPRSGLGLMDVNYAVEKNGQPVASNLPGPYFAEGSTATPIFFEFEGEPNQPVLLMQGAFNPNGWDFLTPGKLDVGVFNPGSGTFSFVEQLAYGADPGYINSLFLTNSVGSLQLAFPIPPFMVGQTFNFQSGILSATIGIALTNMVQVDIVN